MSDKAPIKRYRTLVNSRGVVAWLARKLKAVEKGKLDPDTFRSLAFGAQVLLRGITQSLEEDQGTEGQARMAAIEEAIARTQERHDRVLKELVLLPSAHASRIRAILNGQEPGAPALEEKIAAAKLARIREPEEPEPAPEEPAAVEPQPEPVPAPPVTFAGEAELRAKAEGEAALRAFLANREPPEPAHPDDCACETCRIPWSRRGDYNA